MKRLLTIFTLILIYLTANASVPTPISIAPMLKKVMPAVVNIRVSGEIAIPPSLLQKNQRPSPYPHIQRVNQLGSGVIINARKGYIITNAHVVKHEKTITVTLNDNRHFSAKLIGTDPESDIAVLQIKAKDLHSMPFGNSDKLHVGDFVAAIGSPFGLTQTVTSGIVSALQRNDLNIEGFENFIQTDAAINPGNSGGALVTYEGKLIGINTAIIAPSEGNVGIGFAIPVNMALSISQQLIKYGEVRRGLLGIFAQPLTSELAEAFDLSRQLKGVIISSVIPESPAEKAGLKVRDVILSINGRNVSDSFQVRNIIGLLRVGSRVHLKILRDGKTLNKTAVITDNKVQQQQTKEAQPFLYGISLSNVSHIQSAAHGIISGGIQVINIGNNSLAKTAGLMNNDIIVSANGQPVKNITELHKAIKRNKKELLLHIIRGPGAIFIVIKREE